jgi:hypothetical protein
MGVIFPRFKGEGKRKWVMEERIGKSKIQKPKSKEIPNSKIQARPRQPGDGWEPPPVWETGEWWKSET